MVKLKRVRRKPILCQHLSLGEDKCSRLGLFIRLIRYTCITVVVYWKPLVATVTEVNGEPVVLEMLPSNEWDHSAEEEAQGTSCCGVLMDSDCLNRETVHLRDR